MMYNIGVTIMNCFQIIVCLFEAYALIDSILHLLPRSEELYEVYADNSELTSIKSVISLFLMHHARVTRRRIEFAPVISPVFHGFRH